MCIQCPLAGVTCQYEEIRLQECIKLYISANVDIKGEQLERVEINLNLLHATPIKGPSAELRSKIFLLAFPNLFF